MGQADYNSLLAGVTWVRVPDEEILKLLYPDAQERPEGIPCKVQLRHGAAGFMRWQLMPPKPMALRWFYVITPIASSEELLVFRAGMGGEQICPVCRFSDLTTDVDLTRFKVLMGQSGLEDKEGEGNGDI
jgi:hypothetical protein